MHLSELIYNMTVLQLVSVSDVYKDEMNVFQTGTNHNSLTLGNEAVVFVAPQNTYALTRLKISNEYIILRYGKVLLITAKVFNDHLRQDRRTTLV